MAVVRSGSWREAVKNRAENKAVIGRPVSASFRPAQSRHSSAVCVYAFRTKTRVCLYGLYFLYGSDHANYQTLQHKRSDFVANKAIEWHFWGYNHPSKNSGSTSRSRLPRTSLKLSKGSVHVSSRTVTVSVTPL